MNLRVIIVLFIAVFLAAGCSSVKPLKLRNYSRNLIIQNDRTLYVEKEQVDFKNLKHELIRRLITTTTPITVHIHKDTPPSMAQSLLERLKADGFSDVQVVLFR